MLKQITLLTNICFEPYWRTFVKERFSRLSYDIQFNLIAYEEYHDNIGDVKLSDLIVVCLNFEMLYTDISNEISSGKFNYEAIKKDCIDKCRNLYSYIRNHSKAPVIWFGFEDYYSIQKNNYGALLPFEGVVDQLNLALNDMLKENTFIDFKRLIASVGIKDAYDARGKYRWNAPYSKELICLMADEIYKQYLIATGDTKKCLVLDCDNVLWGGVLSEDGIEGISISDSGLGKPFQDFQRYLLDLYYHGVILALCSKNDESDVLHVFREHTGMILKEEHIAHFICNWNNKPDNIKGISESLNIGLDSIVFVDDSIFEIESVKTILPEVTTVLYQRDSIYDELSCFNLKRCANLQTVRERTSTYKTNILRFELQKNALSYEDYISSLAMNVEIHKAKECELARIAELTQRTNKCTNGTRYTVDQLKEKFFSLDDELYTVCVSDKFSNLGVVGAIEIKGCIIELFSLSCRALGRGIEEKMIKFALGENVKKVRFCDTTKNEGIKTLFEKHGLIKE